MYVVHTPYITLAYLGPNHVMHTPGEYRYCACSTKLSPFTTILSYVLSPAGVTVTGTPSLTKGTVEYDVYAFPAPTRYMHRI